MYWSYACGVKIDQVKTFPFAKQVGVIPNYKGWFLYYFKEHHGIHVYKVKSSELKKPFEKLKQAIQLEINEQNQKVDKYDNSIQKNKRRVSCLNEVQNSNNDFNSFLSFIEVSITNSNNYKKYKPTIEKLWLKHEKRWISNTFEALFLSFWWLFTFHSGIFARFNNRLTYRIALSPLLFFIPHYFGFAFSLFSNSYISINNSILYRLIAELIMVPFSWVPLNELDVILLRFINAPVDYRYVIGEGRIYYGLISPSSLLVFTILVFLIAKVINIRRSK